MSNCERNTLELPEDQGGAGDDPVFELEMLIDGDPVSTAAGVSDVFNFTRFELDQNEIYTFEGALAPSDCFSTCNNSFTMRIRNFEAGSNNVVADRSINPKSFAFRSENKELSDAYQFNFDISSQMENHSYTWTIEDEIFTQQAKNDVRIVNAKMDDNLTARLNVLDEESGLSSFITKQLILDQSVMGVSSSIQIEQIDEDSVAVISLYTESPDFTPLNNVTTWTIEDLNGTNKKLEFLSLNTPLRLRLGSGKKISSTTLFPSVSGLNATQTVVGLDISYDLNNGLLYNKVDFDYTIENRIINGSELDLQTFEFIYIDDNGKTYSSAKGTQSSISFFEIQSVEPFLDNSQGQQTVKIDCTFNCTLFADDGTQKNVQNAQATIALAIP